MNALTRCAITWWALVGMGSYWLSKCRLCCK